MKVLLKQQEIDEVMRNIEQLQLSKKGAQTKQQFLESTMSVKQGGGVNKGHESSSVTMMPMAKIEGESSALHML